MIYKIKNIIHRFIIQISCYIIIFSCFFNLPIITAYIWKINLRKNKRISYKKIIKTAIVLEKSFGIDDLIQSFVGQKSSTLFLIFQRKLLRQIFDFFFRKHLNQINESNYLVKSKLINEKKIKYRIFLSMDQFLKFY